MISITFFFREPRKTGVSIEGIFTNVSECIRDRAIIKSFYCNPVLSRLKNILQVKKYTSQVNHITGDVNFLALGLAGEKTILTIHDFGYYENPVHSKIVKLIYATFWFYLPLKFIDRVTVVSEFTREKLIKYFKYPEDKIRVIPNPVKKIFKFSPRTKINHRPIILMMGSGKHKNLINLVEALKNSNFQLNIIGWPADDEINLLKKYNVQYNIYNGLSDQEVYEHYILCDILFMASLYEGFGMPIIEAQSVGRPVITSNIGAMLEVGKGSALLVDPYKPQEIRAAIISLQDDNLYNDVVEHGRVNAAKYSLEMIAEQYLALYKELAAN